MTIILACLAPLMHRWFCTIMCMICSASSMQCCWVCACSVHSRSSKAWGPCKCEWAWTRWWRGPAERLTGTSKACCLEKTEMAVWVHVKAEKARREKNRVITRTLFRLFWCPQTRVLLVETFAHAQTEYCSAHNHKFFLFFFSHFFFISYSVCCSLCFLYWDLFFHFSFLYCSLKQAPPQER